MGLRAWPQELRGGGDRSGRSYRRRPQGAVWVKARVPAGAGIECGQVFRTEAETAKRCPDTYSFETGV